MDAGTGRHCVGPEGPHHGSRGNRRRRCYSVGTGISDGAGKIARVAFRSCSWRFAALRGRRIPASPAPGHAHPCSDASVTVATVVRAFQAVEEADATFAVRVGRALGKQGPCEPSQEPEWDSNANGLLAVFVGLDGQVHQVLADMSELTYCLYPFGSYEGRHVALRAPVLPCPCPAHALPCVAPFHDNFGTSSPTPLS